MATEETVRMVGYNNDDDDEGLTRRRSEEEEEVDGLVAEYQERIRQFEERETQLLYAAEIGQALLEENQQLKEISKRLEMENEELVNKNQALEVRCATLDELKRLSEEEMAKLNEEISTLEQQLRSSRNELKASAQIAAQFKQLQAELDNWKEETRLSKEAEDAQRKMNSQLVSEIKRMEREIEQNVTNEAKVDVIKLQSEKLQSAEAAREQLQKSLSTVLEENEQLKKASEEKERLVKLVNSLVLANKHLQDVQEEYKASLEEARYKIESLNTSITELKMNPANPKNSSGGDGSIFGELISVISPKPTKRRSIDEEAKQRMDLTPPTPQPRKLPQPSQISPFDQFNPYATLRTTARRRTQSTIEAKPLVNTPVIEKHVETQANLRESSPEASQNQSASIQPAYGEEQKSSSSVAKQNILPIDELLPPEALSVGSDALFEFPPQNPISSTTKPMDQSQATPSSLEKEKEQQIKMELLIQQLKAEVEIRDQKANQAKEHELQLLTTVFNLRERLSASYETLMSPQMRGLIEIHELLAISDTVVGSVMCEAKELLAYEGERKLFGLANEMACQVLELFIELTELAKKFNSNLQKQYDAELHQKIEGNISTLQKPPESPIKTWFSSLWTKKEQPPQTPKEREFEDFGAR